MSEKLMKREISAFAYCLKILVPCILGTILLMGGTIFVLIKFGFPDGAMEANIGFVLILLLNIEIVCPFLIVYKLIRPLQQLNKAAKELAKGNLNVKVDYTGQIAELKMIFLNFQTMTKELASIETLRSDFVSNVSHEFKTPLTAIEGYATLIQNQDILDSEREEYTERILFSTKRLSSLVENILMLSKLENQTIKPEINTYRLDEQILQILLQQESVWNDKGIEFDLDLDEIDYTGAEHFLYHVWSNLISNAVKYSHPKGKIRLSLKQDAHQKRFQITDQGIGISEENLRHIFEKFYQAETSHKSEGNGLGLAQVNKIVDLIEGTITISSVEGVGSTFTVSLPD